MGGWAEWDPVVGFEGALQPYKKPTEDHLSGKGAFGKWDCRGVPLGQGFTAKDLLHKIHCTRFTAKDPLQPSRLSLGERGWGLFPKTFADHLPLALGERDRG